MSARGITLMQDECDMLTAVAMDVDVTGGAINRIRHHLSLGLVRRETRIVHSLTDAGRVLLEQECPPKA